MIRDSKKAHFSTKQESFNKASSSSSTSSWLKSKDPRIVRVSRAFGGKDRHSKVCTIRGLRDRRVRLSVPTAIQLYDLQDRLGLNQPSKVVDWLLNAAKTEIDELPPLPVMPLNLAQYHYPILPSSPGGMSHPNKDEMIRPSWNDDELPLSTSFRNPDSTFLRSKFKGTGRETGNEKETLWMKRNEGKHEDQGIIQTNNPHGSGSSHDLVSSFSNFFPRANQYPTPQGSLLYCHNWEPTNVSSPSHIGSHEDHQLHSFNVHHHVPMPPPTLSLPSAYFPTEFDPRVQASHFQTLMSSSNASQTFISSNPVAPPLYSFSQSVRAFPLRLSPKLSSSRNQLIKD